MVALVGDLGTGKTHLIKGLVQGAGIRSNAVSSPSFTLINEYQGKTPFYHLDLFRLASESEAEDLGLDEYFQGRGITAVEWADKIPSLLPRELLWIDLRHTAEKKTRKIEIRGEGKRYKGIVNQVASIIQRGGK